MSYIIGVDLGTSNSCAAVVKDGKPTIIPNQVGAHITPSVVSYNEDGSCIVGEQAKPRSVLCPERTIYSVKRFMGEGYKEMETLAEKMTYRVAHRNGPLPCFDAGNRWVTPQEVSAEILLRIKENAEAFLGEEVKEAVITVPARFDNAQRTATLEAARLAGLEVRRIINEPTAAAVAYGLDKKGIDCNIAVIHFGGGTFDVTIMNTGDGVFEVKSTNGDTKLGGDDFDRKIIDWMAEEFMKDTNIDLRSNPISLSRMREAAEKAKIELSSGTKAEIDLQYITTVGGMPLNLSLTLTRELFELLCADLIKTIQDPCCQAMREAGLYNVDINEVIMVGGSTRIPAVQREIEKVFRKTPKKDINPEETVAIGAAIQGGVLTGQVKDVLLLDVIPLSLGIETLGGVMTKVFDANTTIPRIYSQIFSTAADNQSEVEIHVLQGENPKAIDNKTIGRFHLTGIPPAPRGVPQIEVTFDIDANGILNVRAEDKATGKVQSVRINNSIDNVKEQIEQDERERLRVREKEKEREEQEKQNQIREKEREEQEKQDQIRWGKIKKKLEIIVALIIAFLIISFVIVSIF